MERKTVRLQMQSLEFGNYLNNDNFKDNSSFCVVFKILNVDDAMPIKVLLLYCGRVGQVSHVRAKTAHQLNQNSTCIPFSSVMNKDVTTEEAQRVDNLVTYLEQQDSQAQLLRQV